MKKYETESIRNLGMFSHGGEGKTSIVDAMLFLAGENTRLGRVDEGTSLMDYEPEEIDGRRPYRPRLPASSGTSTRSTSSIPRVMTTSFTTPSSA